MFHFISDNNFHHNKNSLNTADQEIAIMDLIYLINGNNSLIVKTGAQRNDNESACNIKFVFYNLLLIAFKIPMYTI